MNVEKMSLGPLGTNCYIVYNQSEALIFDPGGNAERIEKFLTENELKPLAILLTHAHFDHIGAVGELRSKYKLDVYLHEAEADWLENPPFSPNSMLLGLDIRTDKPDHLIEPGDMKIGDFQFRVEHTPGHSPGSVSFIFAEASFVISGDVLFAQGVGRTDLEGGNFTELAHSIRTVLYELPDDFTVYSGHGENTQIGFQKENNPFVKS